MKAPIAVRVAYDVLFKFSIVVFCGLSSLLWACMVSFEWLDGGLWNFVERQSRLGLNMSGVGDWVKEVGTQAVNPNPS